MVKEQNMLQATWIVRVDRNGKVYRNEFECSNCGEVIKGKAVKVCPNCSALMEEVANAK
jgi:rubrerythrin